MKIIKFLLVVLMSIIASVGTVFYLSSINLNYNAKFSPIPHMIPNEKMTFLVAGALFFAFYFIAFMMLNFKKYVAFILSSIGIVYGLIQYKVVVGSHTPGYMGFVPGFLSMGMTVCFLMAGGMLIQMVADVVVKVVKGFSKVKKTA